ncbi:hypothetical protein MLD38_016928 [Melastoma candidum]|uniref:Uncharacterized protein n=1 Tax=Melastoma candidum TaxID=119954 RepID=A0ACB9QX78_9MYRT|nr:hypothetical protein MLD38_016928 [Melastoma candidum]
MRNTSASASPSPSPSAAAAIAVFVVILLLPYLSSATAPPSCSAEIVLFSPCLPYVSLPPNDLSPSIPPRCCDVFSSTSIPLVSCLCYLIRQPSMLGFPLNLTKLSRLPADCKVRDGDLPTSDLKSLCSDSPPLPPLRSSPGSTSQNLTNAGPSAAPSQFPELPRDTTINSSLPPGFQSHPKAPPAAPRSAASLCALNQSNLLKWCAVIFLVRSLML